MNDTSDPISNRELMREMVRRHDDLASRLARMDLDAQEARRRHHEQNDALNVMIGRIAVDLAQHAAAHSVRLDQHDSEIEDLQTDMRGVRRDAALMSGGIGVMAFLAQYLPWGKH